MSLRCRAVMASRTSREPYWRPASPAQRNRGAAVYLLWRAERLSRKLDPDTDSGVNHPRLSASDRRTVSGSSIRRLHTAETGNYPRYLKIACRSRTRQTTAEEPGEQTEFAFRHKLCFIEELRRLRARLAQEESLPPYVIFSDKTLIEISCRKIRKRC